jgi:hypothetical protein
MEITAIASLILSSLALLVSGYTNARSVRATRASQSLAAVKDIFGQRHKPEFIEALDAVRHETFMEGTDPSQGYNGLPDNKRTYAYRLSNFYDDLGKLVAHGVVEDKLVIGAYGYSTLWAWEVLEPYLKAQRSINGTSFNIYFEDLAFRVKRCPPDVIHRRLGLAEHYSKRRHLLNLMTRR